MAISFGSKVPARSRRIDSVIFDVPVSTDFPKWPCGD
ncbi:hypothetical protein X726_31420 [Mesorhizobium sp. L103C105A0]|nr:hypothetical protein X726_31420 [Mesorhizobium sp. L103C105A0]